MKARVSVSEDVMRLCRAKTVFLISSALLTLSAPARADVIYLCDDAPPVFVVPSRGMPVTDSAQPCVAAWHDARRREVDERKRRAQVAAANGFTTGKISRDFCVEREACWLPQPRWRKRWDYGTTHRDTIVIMRHW